MLAQPRPRSGKDTLSETHTTGNPHCPFCDHEALEPQIVAETTGFCIAADRQPLYDGHLLLISRAHLPCFGALAPETHAEFVELKARAAAFLVAAYGPCVFFEHGVAGQTVPHAHLHAVPGAPSVLSAVARGRETRAVASWADVHAWYETRGPYLYYEEAGRGTLMAAENVPAGYFQTTLARLQRAAGAPGATLDGEAAARRLRAQWQQDQVKRTGGAIEVVVCFLRRAGRICLLKRSDRLDSVPGKWHTVSGYLPGGAEPLRHAQTEIQEETGLHADQIALLAAGPPVTIDAPWRQMRWRIHPFVFEVREGEPTLNWEHVDKAWVHPHEMRAYDCVRWLPDLYAGLGVS